MTSLRVFLSRLGGLFRKRRQENELNEELRLHLDMLIEENLQKGIPPEEARYAALKAFGGVEQVKEMYREKRGLPAVEAFWGDVRFGLRMLARRLGFTVLVVLTLGLGIGANAAIFSVVDAVLLRPLPYKDSNRLVAVWSRNVRAKGPSKLFDSYKDFEVWRRSSHSFDDLAAATWATGGQTLTWHDAPQEVLPIPVSVEFFHLLGVHAAQGRTFEPGDLKNGCTVVLAHRLWQSRLGATTDILGKNLTLGGKSCAVVGIMPQAFDFYPKQTSLWTLITPDSDFARHPLDAVVGVFGRLKPGVSIITAQAELAVLHRRIASEAPPGNWVSGVTPIVYPLQEEFTWLAGRNLRTGMLVLFAAVFFVLLIACVNVANLLLGRAAERQKELAIRTALGSGRFRMIRQLLTESLLLSVLGGWVGALFALASVRYFRSVNPIELPPGNSVTLNLQVLVFTAILAMATGLLFGIFPAWKASRIDLNESLKEGGRGVIGGALSHRSGRLLVIVEVALALVLLAGAGLLIESVARLGTAPLGFRTDHLLTASVDLPAADYPKPSERVQFYDRLVSDIGALPGVQGVAVSSSLPPIAAPGSDALVVKGRPVPSQAVTIGDVGQQVVSMDYFTVMGIPLLRGREFNSGDREGSQPVAIVNQALVKEYLPGQNPLGMKIKVGGANEKNPWLTIVGVVGTVKRTIVYKEMGYVTGPFIFRPESQAGSGSMAVIVRTAGNPLGWTSSTRREVARLNRNIPAHNFRTMDQIVSEHLAHPRFRAALLGIFAGLALLLAAIGIYGVLSQSVSQRTHEIGIRMALGAERRDVLQLLVGQGLALALIGVGVGIVLALGLTRLIASLLYGVKPESLLILFGVSGVLLLTALLASYLPARRATKVDPMVALRRE